MSRKGVHWRPCYSSAMRLRSKILPIWLLVTSVCVLSPLQAKVTGVEIASRSDVLNGRVFGAAGAHERITGRVYFSLDVANPHNERIVDLKNAVNVKNGVVEFSSDFIAVRPKDRSKSNGSL